MEQWAPGAVYILGIFPTAYVYGRVVGTEELWDWPWPMFLVFWPVTLLVLLALATVKAGARTRE